MIEISDLVNQTLTFINCHQGDLWNLAAIPAAVYMGERLVHYAWKTGENMAELSYVYGCPGVSVDFAKRQADFNMAKAEREAYRIIGQITRNSPFFCP